MYKSSLISDHKLENPLVLQHTCIKIVVYHTRYAEDAILNLIVADHISTSSGKDTV